MTRHAPTWRNSATATCACCTVTAAWGTARGRLTTSIVAAAGGEDLPQAWLDQLAVGGRLVAPMHDASRGGQVLVVVDRRPDGLVTQHHDAVHFVPLKSGAE
jgi:protein-L-isoaspartate O-methyltransferase